MIALAAPAAACGHHVRHALEAQESDTSLEPALVEPLSPVSGVDPRRARVGRRLFFDKRLSRDESISCASCHDLARGGADGRRVSVGVDGHTGVRNAPSVLNAALSFTQFWDGRAPTLEAQALAPVDNPNEMGASWPVVVARIRADESLSRDLAAEDPRGVTAGSIVAAIAAYERTLLPLDSPFDRSLRGDESALSAQAKDGYRLFKALGCVACHQGRGLGGNMFQKLGVVVEVPVDDPGRFAVTGDPRDRSTFKVPSLRNVALTAPYLHDGSAATLEDAVRTMGWHQLGVHLGDADVARLVAFLASLTGAPPQEDDGA